MTIAGESGETRSDHRRLLDRRFVALLEVAQQPACRDARMPARILACDQDRQLESIGEVERRELLGGRLGNEQVAVFERPAKYRPWVPLRGRGSSSPGPDGPSLGTWRGD